MKRYGWIQVFCIIAIAGMGQNRYIETYEGSRIAAPMPLDSALTANVLDLADCEIYSAAFIRYDQRGDTAMHETMLDTRRDFKLSGDSPQQLLTVNYYDREERLIRNLMLYLKTDSDEKICFNCNIIVYLILCICKRCTTCA